MIEAIVFCLIQGFDMPERELYSQWPGESVEQCQSAANHNMNYDEDAEMISLSVYWL